MSSVILVLSNITLMVFKVNVDQGQTYTQSYQIYINTKCTVENVHHGMDRSTDKASLQMAYFIQSKRSDVRLTYLPKTTVLRSGRKVVLDYYDEKYEAEVHAILRYIVNEEGNSYPQDDMVDIEAFRRYYLSHEVFVCTDAQTDEVLGAFYIKPNFPGRCSHICNAGFIVKASERGQGIGHMMAENYLYMARDLGYKASFFNLVFVSNEASIYLWRKLGFKEIGRVPNAGNLKGIGYTDAIQFYYDFTSLGETK